MTYFFDFLPKEEINLFKEDGKINVLGKKVKAKLFDPIRTIWVARIGRPDLSKDAFVSVGRTLEFFCLHPESKVNRDTVVKSQALLNHLSIFFFHCNSCTYKKNICLYSLCHSPFKVKTKPNCS